MSNEKNKYKPITEWKMRVGGRVSTKRINDLSKFLFDGIDDLSTDDIVAVCSGMIGKLAYGLIGTAEELWGEEKTLEMCEKTGRKLYNINWRRIQKRFNVIDLSPEQIAWYQDMAHLFYGPTTEAYTEYDDEKCVVTRERCIMKASEEFLHLKKYDEAMCNGVLKGYMDCQPSLTCERVCSYGRPEDLKIKVDLDRMCYRGGSLCQIIWRVKK